MWLHVVKDQITDWMQLRDQSLIREVLQNLPDFAQTSIIVTQYFQGSDSQCYLLTKN